MKPRAVHLEMRDTYTPDDQRFLDWLAGRPAVPGEPRLVPACPDPHAESNRPFAVVRGLWPLRFPAGRQKGRNLLGNQKVSLLVVDPGNTSRFVQIRGDAELVTEGAREHLDALTRKYTSHPAYYGYIYPQAQRLARPPRTARTGIAGPLAGHMPW